MQFRDVSTVFRLSKFDRKLSTVLRVQFGVGELSMYSQLKNITIIS